MLPLPKMLAEENKPGAKRSKRRFCGWRRQAGRCCGCRGSPVPERSQGMGGTFVLCIRKTLLLWHSSRLFLHTHSVNSLGRARCNHYPHSSLSSATSPASPSPPKLLSQPCLLSPSPTFNPGPPLMPPNMLRTARSTLPSQKHTCFANQSRCIGQMLF